jgi:predicted amidohydrolase
MLTRTAVLMLAALAAQAQTDWAPWSARPEIAPATWRDGAVLVVGGAGNAAVYGGWVRTLPDIRGGRWYRFAAAYQAVGVEAENWQVVARVDWLDASGHRTGQPAYAAWAHVENSWTTLSATLEAPEKASAAKVELLLANAPRGRVSWRDIELKESAAPAPRRITVASINQRPGAGSDPVGVFLETAAAVLPKELDLIVFPEGITVVGTGKRPAEVAEAVPGPTTARLGALARSHQAWIVAGLYERDGVAIYNTAVLLDRGGRVAGKYRKVYLPREEVEAGLTPGSAYPVFQTDFGRVGLMICYDVFFPDPARALAAQGADLIAMPIWGGDETLARARAIENQVFLVASGYDHPTYVMDPAGTRLAQAAQRGEAAVVTIDLEHRYTDLWLGEMRTRRLKELRLDVVTPPPGRLP